MNLFGKSGRRLKGVAEIPEYVLDASVAVKWHLRDEEHAALALQILRDFREGRVGLLAPDHICYEVASAVQVAVLRDRITVEEGRSSLADFYGWGIPTVRGESLIFFAYDQALKLHCSFYDALYLALAQSANAPLISADEKLRHTIGQDFPLALWIEDYRAR